MGADGAYVEVSREDGVELVPLSGDRVTLGRAAVNAVSFPHDSAISRVHAVIQRVTDGWQLGDMGSVNGTFVNGSKLSTQQLLRPGDEVLLGESRLTYRAEAPVAGATDHVTRAYSGATQPERVTVGGAVGGYLDLSEEWRAPRGKESPPEPGDASRAPQQVASGADSEAQPVRASTATQAPASPAVTQESLSARRGAAHIRGIARGVQVRRREQDTDVLSFRVDRYDDSGDRLAPVGVELPGYKRGQIGEGEEVDVIGKWSRGTLRATKVTNLSTSAEIDGAGRARKIALVCVSILIACFFAFIIYSIVTAPSVSNPFQ